MSKSYELTMAAAREWKRLEDEVTDDGFADQVDREEAALLRSFGLALACFGESWLAGDDDG